ncbi:MAG: D-alanine--poly(phosphoribitol) ligase [Acidobacteria bacterium]|nr:MAG: D-alanine--poly(phosphoribitol) ligase [Acidobacteriota bacterium]
MSLNLAHGFYESSLRFPDNIALSIGTLELTYAQLRELAQPVADWLRRNKQVAAPRVGILASRSLSTYAGILGTCWGGGTYVPISTKLPEDRLIQLLGRIRAEALIVDSESLLLLSQRVLSHCPRLILGPELATSVEMRSDANTKVVVTGKGGLSSFDAEDRPVPVEPKNLGYIEFTSGTTGIPKGVTISAGAVAHFIGAMQARYAFEPTDRVAGLAEITFDISVFDMFATWNCGAALCVAPATQLIAPAGFIHRQRATVIFTVPSVASNMKRMKMLVPGAMPSLRYSLFSGEPLPVISATLWMQAAPNSIVDDLFGPTEATVVCTGQRFTGPENATPNRGVVAIGKPFDGMEVAIVDPALQVLPDGEQGELLLAGPQLSSGYFDAEDLTRASFPVLQGKRWYRTGDLAYRDTSGIFHHLGRIDNQVKVRGLRVELEEVEAYLREIYRTDSVAAVAWPVDHGSANGIVAFVSGQFGMDDPDIRTQIKDRLPGYMVPSTVHRVDSLPLNANGKVNRKQLFTLLDEGKF